VKRKFTVIPSLLRRILRRCRAAACQIVDAYRRGSTIPNAEILQETSRVIQGRLDLGSKPVIRVNLSPGMAVTVEIKNGSRMILSYLFGHYR
jgi:hypothetical protein